eukprot:TRINITY_DN2613_c0_g1_i1.p1 TRINITY_DN2613_c0_g1~~TRINITY_DN2613_c0_g1_i1.p1  ORF type:complete len:215 (+),score=2.14 TRINITY_DN2613_c0_g1_i1:182-826(+)
MNIHWRTRDLPVLKIVVAGDPGVGKTSLLVRFCEGEFSNAPSPSTVGIDFKYRSTEVDKQPIRLQVWDTAGQERFRNLTSSFYRGADGVMLVYDLSDAKSFEHIEEWLKDIQKWVYARTPILIVGNKKDMNSQRAVTHQQIIDLVRRHNLLHVEASALNSEHVDEAFNSLAHCVVHHKIQRSQSAVRLTSECEALKSKQKTKKKSFMKLFRRIL